jgi:hypothetical protein
MMKRLVLVLDGAFVLGLGIYMLFLSQADAYTAFMNPKFRPLTAAAAVGLCIVGAAFLIRPPDGRPDMLRTLCFGVLAMLILHAGAGVITSSEVFAVKPPEARNDPEPHVARNGDTYLKANPARLFLLLQAGAAPADQRYATRGMVKRSAQLDGRGRFALLRGNMVCCLADAIAMGVMVAADGGQEFQDGDWVMAFGRAHATPEPQPVTDMRGAGEVPFAMVYERAVFVAEALERIERPRFPYVFELPTSAKGPNRLTGGDDDY